MTTSRASRLACVLASCLALAAAGVTSSAQAALATDIVDASSEFPPVPDVSRIVPVNGDIAEIVYALGLGDHVVATDISATYPAEADDTPKIGYQRTLVAETILSFEPTVVIADERAGPPEVFDALRAAGVDVVVIEHRVDLSAPSYKIRAVASVRGARRHDGSPRRWMGRSAGRVLRLPGPGARRVPRLTVTVPRTRRER